MIVKFIQAFTDLNLHYHWVSHLVNPMNYFCELFYQINF